MNKKIIMDFESKKINFGKKDQTIVIAEAGVNHNTDTQIAKKMIDVAKESGADIVKFQLFDSSKEISVHADKADYQKENDPNTGKNQLELCKSLELTQKQIKIIQKYCQKVNMPFLVTAFEEYSLEYLVEIMGLKTIKIPSPEITNIPFLEKIAKKKVSAILSTGASTMTEVRLAITTLKKNGIKNLIVLHCISQYPAPFDQINLRAMKTMEKEFGVPVGFSDHTQGIYVPIAATAMGACAVEKHFTLSRKMKGPDHIASVEPNQLKEMVTGIKIANIAKGKKEKQPALCEKETRPLIRKSIVAGEDIPKGTIIKPEMLEIKRPSGGIEPKYYKKIIGKKTKNSIKYDQLIKWKDIVD